MKPLDIRDIAIMNAFPFHERDVLTIGCGEGRLEWYLTNENCLVLATDITNNLSFDDETTPLLKFEILNILNSEFDISPVSVVICSEVLEHLADYKTALSNLLKLTEVRLIITVPVEMSFCASGHCNFWNDRTVNEFKELCSPYSVSISKIRTKPEDVKAMQWCYLIVVDKNQRFEVQ